MGIGMPKIERFKAKFVPVYASNGFSVISCGLAVI
jgi:hypothetical protein